MTDEEITLGSEVECGDGPDYAFGVVVGSRYGALSGYTYWTVEWVLGGDEPTECLASQLRARVVCPTCHESTTHHDPECDPWWES